MASQSPTGHGSDGTNTAKTTANQQSMTNVNNTRFQAQLESELSAVEMSSAVESEKDNAKPRQLLKRRPTFSSTYGRKKYLWKEETSEKNGESDRGSVDSNLSSFDKKECIATGLVDKSFQGKALESEVNNLTSEDERKFSRKVSRDKKLKKKEKPQQGELREFYKIAPRSDGEEADDEREK